MSTALRRTIYSLIAALGIVLMVPLAVNMRRLSAEAETDPSALGSMLDPAQAEWFSQLMGLFLLGVLIAACFGYLALTTGYERAWRPKRNGEPRCQRCGAVLQAGAIHCPSCDQRLIW